MEHVLSFCVTNLLGEKRLTVEKQRVGWLEGSQIRLCPKSQDSVPLFLLPRPHNDLLLGPGSASSSSSTQVCAHVSCSGQVTEYSEPGCGPPLPCCSAVTCWMNEGPVCADGVSRGVSPTRPLASCVVTCLNCENYSGGEGGDGSGDRWAVPSTGDRGLCRLAFCWKS